MCDSRKEMVCKSISGLCLALVLTLACTAIALGQNARPIHTSHNWEYAVTVEVSGPAVRGE